MRRGGLALLLLGSASLPYALSTLTPSENSKPDDVPAANLATSADSRATVAPLGETPPLASAREIHSIEEALRFDINPQWVLASWPRVSTALGDLESHGYRVSLVSGTGTSDIAGSLTYYFDANRKTSKITFQGTTGDPRRLVAWLKRAHRFLLVEGADPRATVYQARKFGKPTGELRVTPAKVVSTDAPHARFEVVLAMDNPE